MSSTPSFRRRSPTPTARRPTTPTSSASSASTPHTGQPVSEYVYLLEDVGFSATASSTRSATPSTPATAVFRHRARLLTETFGKKFIFEVDLKGATNLIDAGAPALPAGETLEQQTADDLADLGIQPVNKIKVTQPSVHRLSRWRQARGSCASADGTLAVLNDNDFSLTGDLDTATGAVGVVEPTWPRFSGSSPSATATASTPATKTAPSTSQTGRSTVSTCRTPWPVYEVNGETFYVTANEGDDRGENERIEDLTLDPDAFPARRRTAEPTEASAGWRYRASMATSTAMATTINFSHTAAAPSRYGTIR